MLILTGVSFRFGSVCHINIENSTYDYWIPVLIFAGAALVLQIATMAYCIHIYLKTLFSREPSAASDGLPSYAASVRSINARQAYRRIRKVFRLQWRGVAFVFIIVANALLYSIVFIDLDDSVKMSQDTYEKALPWVLCLSISKGDKEGCKKYAANLGPSATTLLAVLIFLSLVGLWNVLLFIRPSMFQGWVVLFKNAFQKRKQNVSADARTLLPNSADAHAFEMIYNTKGPEAAIARSPTPERAAEATSPGSSHSPQSSEGSSYGWDKEYVKKPPMSFSMSFSMPRPNVTSPIPRVTSPPPRLTSPSPRVTSPTGGDEWDPRDTFAASSQSPTPGRFEGA